MMYKTVTNKMLFKLYSKSRTWIVLFASAITILCCTTQEAEVAEYDMRDLSGPWEIQSPVTALRTQDGGVPPLTDEGKKLYLANQANPDTDPMMDCLPPGIPRTLMQQGFPFSIVLGKSIGAMFIEWNHLPRPIYLDREHFENIGPTYLGQSIGHWENNTLVIHTNGFNEMTWLDSSGLPHSGELEVVERLSLLNENTLQAEFTITDSVVFSEPWTTVVRFDKRPGYIVKEDYCLGRTGQGVTKSITTDNE